MTHPRGGNGENSHVPPRLVLVAGLLAALLLSGGCGRSGGDNGGTASGELSGLITADGSSTVGPFVTAAAELFQKEQSDVQVTVGISGTGGGFERFCRGETDISNCLARDRGRREGTFARRTASSTSSSTSQTTGLPTW